MTNRIAELVQASIARLAATERAEGAAAAQARSPLQRQIDQAAAQQQSAQLVDGRVWPAAGDGVLVLPAPPWGTKPPAQPGQHDPRNDSVLTPAHLAERDQVEALTARMLAAIPDAIRQAAEDSAREVQRIRTAVRAAEVEQRTLGEPLPASVTLDERAARLARAGAMVEHLAALQQQLAAANERADAAIAEARWEARHSAGALAVIREQQREIERRREAAAKLEREADDVQVVLASAQRRAETWLP